MTTTESDELEPGWLRRQLAQASESVRRMKRCSPYIFPEYQEVTHANVALKAARERHRLALQRWRQLGANDTK